MAKKLSKFGAAFDAARKGGSKEFKFGGKSYNTKLKEDAPVKKLRNPPTALPKTTSKAIPTPRRGGITIGNTVPDRQLSAMTPSKGVPKTNKVVDGEKRYRDNLGNSKTSAGKSADTIVSDLKKAQNDKKFKPPVKPVGTTKGGVVRNKYKLPKFF